MPKLPVLNPTTILSPVMTTAARTEFPAAERFSARIKSEGEMAGLPDMQELSPLRRESAKQIAAEHTRVLVQDDVLVRQMTTSREPEERPRLVLRFGA